MKCDVMIFERLMCLKLQDEVEVLLALNSVGSSAFGSSQSRDRDQVSEINFSALQPC